MNALHVIVVESASQCAAALSLRYRVDVFAKADAAYRAIVGSGAAALVVHVEETDDFEERVGLIRKVQQNDATRAMPILVVITQKPDRPSAMTAQRYGSAVIKLTTPDCAGLAEALEEMLWEVR